MADPFTDALQPLPPAQDLRGFGWARFTLVLFGLGAVILSFACVGLPLVYAVVLAWRAVDEAEAYTRSGDHAQAAASATGFLSAVKWATLAYALLFVVYAVAIVAVMLVSVFAGGNFPD